MSNNNSILILFFLLSIGSLGYAQIKGSNLFVNRDFNIKTLVNSNTDSVKRVYFINSTINNLDSNWLILRNVKEIHFSQNSTIPRNLDLIEVANAISFSNYARDIYFPDDFPFEKYIQVSFYFVNPIPHSINKFKKIQSLSIHNLSDTFFLHKIAKILSQITELNLSDIIMDNSDFCKLSSLQKLNFSMLFFTDPNLKMGCLINLQEISIVGTNLVQIQESSSILSKIYLHKNELPSEEIARLREKYKNLKAVIW